MRKFKKLFAVVTVLALMFTMLAGCGSSSSEGNGGSASGEKTVIYMANHMAGEAASQEFWETFKNDFNAQSDEYELKYVIAGYNDMVKTITTTIGGGGDIDMIFAESPWIAQFAESGLINPIEDVMSADFIASFNDDMFNAYQYEGEAYGFPLCYSNSLLFVNKNYVEQAGLDINNPPTTEAELWVWMEALSKLTTETGEKVYPIGIPFAEGTSPGQHLNSMILAFGGQLLDADGNLAVDNNVAFTEFLDFMVALDEKDYNPDSMLLKDLRSMFATGKVAMTLDTSMGIGTSVGLNPDVLEYATTINMPAMGSIGNGDTMFMDFSMAVNVNDEVKAEGVRQVAEMLMTEEYMGHHMADINPAFASTKDLNDVELWAMFDQILDQGVQIGNQPSNSKLSSIQVDLTQLLSAIIITGTPIDQAVEDFKSEANALLKS